MVKKIWKILFSVVWRIDRSIAWSNRSISYFVSVDPSFKKPSEDCFVKWPHHTSTHHCTQMTENRQGYGIGAVSSSSSIISSPASSRFCNSFCKRKSTHRKTLSIFLYDMRSYYSMVRKWLKERDNFNRLGIKYGIISIPLHRPADFPARQCHLISLPNVPFSLLSRPSVLEDGHFFEQTC